MDTVKNLNKWANAHTSYPLDLLRIALGIFLIIKGISFITNRQYLHEIMNQMYSFGSEMLMVHYIAAAHMMGGLMIAFGLLTRWSIWAQLPILIGAVAVNFIGTFNVQNFILASVTLILCIFFLFYGSGKHSADYYFKMQQ
ncbi:DoxX family protein [Flavobacterium sp. SM15]|uniref:DoxX family protein n=1 Tax=Flavobacterium sp. SM15 TaxID=2908005 RepID=UPI001EDAE408|nr:DoxX family protein [Flavobacterium sp. SM15]MCG2611478.1 DoxX family protein [Flavobacterium sp. SM15]